MYVLYLKFLTLLFLKIWVRFDLMRFYGKFGTFCGEKVSHFFVQPTKFIDNIEPRPHHVVKFSVCW